MKSHSNSTFKTIAIRYHYDIIVMVLILFDYERKEFHHDPINSHDAAIHADQRTK